VSILLSGVKICRTFALLVMQYEVATLASILPLGGGEFYIIFAFLVARDGSATSASILGVDSI
jgi:hypothetical protein